MCTARAAPFGHRHRALPPRRAEQVPHRCHEPVPGHEHAHARTTWCASCRSDAAAAPATFRLAAADHQRSAGHKVMPTSCRSVFFTPPASGMPVTLRALSGPYRRPLSPYASAYAPETPWKSPYAHSHIGAWRPRYTLDSAGETRCLFHRPDADPPGICLWGMARRQRRVLRRFSMIPPAPPGIPMRPAAPSGCRQGPDGARARLRGDRRPRGACRAAAFG